MSDPEVQWLVTLTEDSKVGRTNLHTPHHTRDPGSIQAPVDSRQVQCITNDHMGYRGTVGRLTVDQPLDTPTTTAAEHAILSLPHYSVGWPHTHTACSRTRP